MQETLHLFGLQHAGTADYELSSRPRSTEGDPTSPMGCERCGSDVSICPNAPQMCESACCVREYLELLEMTHKASRGT